MPYKEQPDPSDNEIPRIWRITFNLTLGALLLAVVWNLTRGGIAVSALMVIVLTFEIAVFGRSEGIWIPLPGNNNQQIVIRRLIMATIILAVIWGLLVLLGLLF